MNSWQVGVAAEAFSAAMFARIGFDVSVQYGANQPEYDLIVAQGELIAKVSVKGSQDGSWGLTQSWLKRANYHEAVDNWLAKHSSSTIFCFVQFKAVSTNELPRFYLASPIEVGNRLKESAAGRGDTILYEYKEWTDRAFARGTVDRIPDSWQFSEGRLKDLIG